MSIIYQPSGRAKEYCEQAANLYRGCSHGCKYCYAPSALRMDRDKFHSQAEPRKDVVAKLKKDAESGKYKGPVLLCFTTDPYQQANDEHGITGQAIKILKDNNIPVEILTKGGNRALDDLDLLDSSDKIGSTLTFVREDDSLEWEPFAAPPIERFNMLKQAHKKGIKTWASLEPVIDTEQTLSIIEQTMDYVDLFKVGKLNYNPIAKTIDWHRFAHEVVRLLKFYNLNYYIKNDLRRYLDTEAAC